MSTEDTEPRYARNEQEVPPRLDPGGDPPGDDRNDELDESPVPDPEQPSDADDDPEAD
jgi:hypothetical protein